MIQGTDAHDMVLEIIRPNSTGNKDIVSDNEGPHTLFTKKLRESKFVYMFDSPSRLKKPGERRIAR